MVRLYVVLMALLTACVVDPFSSTGRKIRSARDAARAGDVAEAYVQLREADALAEDDPALRREVRLADLEVERSLVARLSKDLAVTPDVTALAAAWSLRERNARTGGSPAVDVALVDKMRMAFGVMLDRAEAELVAGRPQAIAPVLAVARYPDVDDAIQAARRIAALASTVAARHGERAKASATYPLAARGHIGLAAHVLGGAMPPAHELVAPMQVSVAVRADAVPACGATADALTRRFSRQGGDRRIEIVLELGRCEESETTSASKEEVTWTEQVPYETTETLYRQECTTSTYSVTGQRCTVTEPLPSGLGGRVDCYAESVPRTVTSCTSVPYTAPTIRYRAEPRSGVRDLTRHRTVVTFAGSFVVRRDGQPDRRGVLRGEVAREDQTYPALGTLHARTRDSATTLPYLLAQGRTQLEAPIAAAVSAALAVDLDAARAVLADARARGDREQEEDAQMRLILLGDDAPGVLGTRYGVTAADVRAAFYATRFVGWHDARPAVSLPAAIAVAELTDSDRAEVERRRRTGLPPPMVARGWFTLGVGGFSTSSVVAPGTTTDLLGFAGMTATLRGGASVLGRWRGGKTGFVLADDAAVRIDLGYPLARAEDQFDGGTALRIAAEYTLAAGFRVHRRGGLMVGARAIASHELLDGNTFVSVPLFGRVEVPLPTGSLCLEVFGGPVAGAPTVGGALYLTAETLRRGDTSSQFVAIRAERTTSDRTASFTDDNFQDMIATFADVQATQVTVELGAAF